MGSIREVVSILTRLGLTLLVPAAVWTLLIVGLYQFVRGSIRRVRVPPRTVGLTRVGEGRQVS